MCALRLLRCFDGETSRKSRASLSCCLLSELNKGKRKRKKADEMKELNLTLQRANAKRSSEPNRREKAVEAFERAACARVFVRSIRGKENERERERGEKRTKAGGRLCALRSAAAF